MTAPRRIALLMLFALMVACTGARESALRGSLTAVNAARDAFVSYDRSHQLAIVDAASTDEEAGANLSAWRKQRVPILETFAVAYRSIAVATLDTHTSLTDVFATVEALVGAVRELTRGGDQ